MESLSFHHKIIRGLPCVPLLLRLLCRPEAIRRWGGIWAWCIEETDIESLLTWLCPTVQTKFFPFQQSCKSELTWLPGFRYFLSSSTSQRNFAIAFCMHRHAPQCVPSAWPRHSSQYFGMQTGISRPPQATQHRKVYWRDHKRNSDSHEKFHAYSKGGCAGYTWLTMS